MTDNEIVQKLQKTLSELDEICEQLKSENYNRELKEKSNYKILHRRVSSLSKILRTAIAFYNFDPKQIDLSKVREISTLRFSYYSDFLLKENQNNVVHDSLVPKGKALTNKIAGLRTKNPDIGELIILLNVIKASGNALVEDLELEEPEDLRTMMAKKERLEAFIQYSYKVTNKIETCLSPTSLDNSLSNIRAKEGLIAWEQEYRKFYATLTTEENHAYYNIGYRWNIIEDGFKASESAMNLYKTGRLCPGQQVDDIHDIQKKAFNTLRSFAAIDGTHDLCKGDPESFFYPRRYDLVVPLYLRYVMNECRRIQTQNSVKIKKKIDLYERIALKKYSDSPDGKGNKRNFLQARIRGLQFEIDVNIAERSSTEALTVASEIAMSMLTDTPGSQEDNPRITALDFDYPNLRALMHSVEPEVLKGLKVMLIKSCIEHSAITNAFRFKDATFRQSKYKISIKGTLYLVSKRAHDIYQCSSTAESLLKISEIASRESSANSFPSCFFRPEESNELMRDIKHIISMKAGVSEPSTVTMTVR